MPANSQTSPVSRLMYFVIFAAGFSFLLFEVSWNRLLALALGTTVTASTIVLASFMAGFGYGALFWGRRATGRKELHRLLALLLVGMGLTGSIDLVLFDRVLPFLNSGGEGKAALPAALIYILTAFLLFWPAFHMGGVFPVASRLAALKDRNLARTLGGLYAVETLGSALGGLLSGFVLLGFLGQQATVILGILVCIGVGIWVQVDRRFRVNENGDPERAPDQPAPGRRSRKRDDSEQDRSLQLRAATLGALFFGFALLTLQVFWLRIFKVYLTNTSYSFALVASLAVLGLFTGSSIFRRRSRLVAPSPSDLVKIMWGMIITTALGLVLLVRLPQTLMFPLQEMLSDPALRVLGLPALAALLVVFPPAIFSGYALPLACSLFTTSRQGMSGDVGFILMINTIGSVVGPVLAAFVLIPTLGAVLGVVVVLAWLALGAWLIGRGRGGQGQQGTGAQVAALAVLAVALVLVVWRPEIRTLPPSFLAFDRLVLHYQEEVEGTISVARDRDTRSQALYTFVNNSAVIGSSYDAVKVVKMVGHFPFLLGAEIEDVLVIGFGIGVTTSAIADHPEVQRIDCVELVPGLQQAAVHYKERNRNVLEDPRLTIHGGDGRNFLLRSGKQYDLISCDPTHPILGSGNLYTRDYFELCLEHLSPGGMVSQYLPLHKLRSQDLLGIMATFAEVFPHTTIWLGHYHAVLIGGRQDPDLDFVRWRDRIQALPPDNDFLLDPHHLAATFMLDGEALRALGTGSGINTDDLSYTEFFHPDCLLPENTAANLQFLEDNRKPVTEVFRNIDDVALMDRYIKGNALLNESLHHGLTGNRAGSLRALQAAARANPENKEYPFLLRLNF
jgi:spermidine synthase